MNDTGKLAIILPKPIVYASTIEHLTTFDEKEEVELGINTHPAGTEVQSCNPSIATLHSAILTHVPINH